MKDQAFWWTNSPQRTNKSTPKSKSQSSQKPSLSPSSWALSAPTILSNPPWMEVSTLIKDRTLLCQFFRDSKLINSIRNLRLASVRSLLTCLRNQTWSTHLSLLGFVGSCCSLLWWTFSASSLPQPRSWPCSPWPASRDWPGCRSGTGLKSIWTRFLKSSFWSELSHFSPACSWLFGSP